jgi:hypothetical protein
MMLLQAFYLTLNLAANVGIYCRLTVFFSLFILTKPVEKRYAINSYICTMQSQQRIE